MISNDTQALAVIMLIIALIGVLAAPFIPLYDFEHFFYPAAVKLAHFQDPYSISGFYNPPWALIPLLPLGWLPLPIAKSIFFAAMLTSFLYIPHRLGFKWWQVLLFVLSPPVLSCLWIGNLEWLVLLGLLLPAPFSTLLFLIKPQVGIGLALLAILREDNWEWSIALPVLGIAVGWLLFPTWQPPPGLSNPTAQNYTLWPYGLLLGIPLLILGIRDNDKYKCLLAGPLLSPYTLLYSWAGAVLAIVKWTGGNDE